MDYNEKAQTQKNITLKLAKSDIPVTKIRLKSLQENNSDLKVDSFRVSQFGEYYLLSFNINEKYYETAVKKLAGENIQLVTKENKPAQESKSVPSEALPLKSQKQPVIEERSQQNTSPAKLLEQAVSGGDYEKVIRISKEVKHGFEIMKRAKESIDDAVRKAIAVEIKNAEVSQYKAEESISALIEIGSNKSLRLLNKTELMTEVGISAIKICQSSYHSIDNLIKIANNNQMPHIVVVKAAVKFGEIILNNPELFDEDVLYAVKNLNIRWLLISFDIVMEKLTSKEKILFNDLIKYLRSARKENYE